MKKIRRLLFFAGVLAAGMIFRFITHEDWIYVGAAVGAWVLIFMVYVIWEEE